MLGIRLPIPRVNVVKRRHITSLASVPTLRKPRRRPARKRTR